jgi:hypothetical protein
MEGSCSELDLPRFARNVLGGAERVGAEILRPEALRIDELDKTFGTEQSQNSASGSADRTEADQGEVDSRRRPEQRRRPWFVIQHHRAPSKPVRKGCSLSSNCGDPFENLTGEKRGAGEHSEPARLCDRTLQLLTGHDESAMSHGHARNDRLGSITTDCDQNVARRRVTDLNRAVGIDHPRYPKYPGERRASERRLKRQVDRQSAQGVDEHLRRQHGELVIADRDYNTASFEAPKKRLL